MTENTPIDPDVLQAVIEAMELADYSGVPWEQGDEAIARVVIGAYLAVAQPVVNSVEELATTHVGRALANAAFNEGMSAGIRACNDSLDGEPFVKPVSPYRPESS